MFGAKDSKINQLQMTIEYQTNEQSTKYSNWNVVAVRKLLGNTKYDQIKLVLAVFASAFLKQVSIKLY